MMIELKIDEFENGKVLFHIERQDLEDYDRLQKQSCSFEINGVKFLIRSGAYPAFFIEDRKFFVRGELKTADFDRIEVSIAEYLIIYELVKKYNEKFY